jgi:hypothetical protein
MRPPILFCFTPEELIDELHLHELELHHLAILNAAVFYEIQNSEEIKNILKERIRDIYSKLKPPYPPEPSSLPEPSSPPEPSPPSQTTRRSRRR